MSETTSVSTKQIITYCCISLDWNAPVNICIEKNMLSLFGSITRAQSCIENQIARRQLAVKDIADKSWFSSVRSILNDYMLPTAYELIDNPPRWNLRYMLMLNSNGKKI